MSKWGDRRVRFELHSFEALIAFLCLVTAIQFVIDPDNLQQSRTAEILPGVWLQIWNVLLGVGAFGILAGLWSARGDWEAAGLFALCGAMVVQIGAVVTVTGKAGLVGSAIATAVVLACLARASQLMKVRR